MPSVCRLIAESQSYGHVPVIHKKKRFSSRLLDTWKTHKTNPSRLVSTSNTFQTRVIHLSPRNRQCFAPTSLAKLACTWSTGRELQTHSFCKVSLAQPTNLDGIHIDDQLCLPSRVKAVQFVWTIWHIWKNAGPPLCGVTHTVVGAVSSPFLVKFSRCLMGSDSMGFSA